MTNGEAINWLRNIAADIGKAEHRELWHYEQAIFEIMEMLEAQPETHDKRTETHGVCLDTISRKAAIKEAYSVSIGGEVFDVVQVETLMGLPAATYRNLEKPKKPQHSEDGAADCNLDLISRQAAIEVADAVWTVTGDKNVAKVWQQINDLPSAQPDLDEWCIDCKEYDSERHCCPRYNRVIRDAVEEAKKDRINCAHCKRYDRHGHRCKWWNHGVSNVDWCSYAERKEE